MTALGSFYSFPSSACWMSFLKHGPTAHPPPPSPVYVCTLVRHAFCVSTISCWAIYSSQQSVQLDLNCLPEPLHAKHCSHLKVNCLFGWQYLLCCVVFLSRMLTPRYRESTQTTQSCLVYADLRFYGEVLVGQWTLQAVCKLPTNCN